MSNASGSDATNCTITISVDPGVPEVKVEVEVNISHQVTRQRQQQNIENVILELLRRCLNRFQGASRGLGITLFERQRRDGSTIDVYSSNVRCQETSGPYIEVLAHKLQHPQHSLAKLLEQFHSCKFTNGEAQQYFSYLLDTCYKGNKAYQLKELIENEDIASIGSDKKKPCCNALALFAAYALSLYNPRNQQQANKRRIRLFGSSAISFIASTLNDFHRVNAISLCPWEGDLAAATYAILKYCIVDPISDASNSRNNNNGIVFKATLYIRREVNSGNTLVIRCE